jgi:uncharacterized protein (DUF1501 family)
MLTILGPRHGGYCDHISRRSFLQIGGLALGGLSLPQLLRAEAAAGNASPHKAVIMIFLSGGPPHQDMFDLKPDAPVEVRGEFRPIRSKVPGIDVCELLPRIGQRMDKFALLRAVVGAEDRHAAFQCLTGKLKGNQPQGGWPALGAVVSKLQGSTEPAIPAFVSLVPKMKTAEWGDPGPAGFLGQAHAPFQPAAAGRADMVLNGANADQLGDRKKLLAGFDQFRRTVDATGTSAAMDQFTEQAYGILTSDKLAKALDLDREDHRVRDRYGRGSPEPAGYGDAGPLLNDYFLLARRLVEAGVRVVTLAYGRWDWHGKPYGTTFENSRDHFPMLDLGLSALIDDLYDRGLDKDVTVIVWGEFGRTPKINKEVGRDHWPAVSCALLSGGGLKTGQVIGATDRQAAYAKERPVSFAEVFATLYHNLGINAGETQLKDYSGRPHYLVDNVQPVRELI